MPVYLTPGVYIEEIPSGARPIEGVATSVAAIIGPAERGPAGEATLIGSLDDYKTHYGDIASDTDAMGIAVQSFYLNGGKSAYICRLTGTGAAAASVDINGEGTGGTPTANPVLVITASSVGAWGEDIYVMIDKPDPDSTTFDLLVGHREDGEFVEDESFFGLTMREGTDDYVIGAVNDGSTLVEVSLGTDGEIGSSAYQDATIVGGDTGTAATYFSAALGGSTTETLSLNLNGRGFESISVDLTSATFAGADHDTDAGELATAVEAAIHAHSTLLVFQDVTVAYAGGRFTVTSPENESHASLAIGSGTLATLMRLTANDRAVLTGQAQPASATRFSGGSGFANQASNDIVLTIDGHGPTTVTLAPSEVTLIANNTADGEAVAAHIETAVRNAEPDLPGYSDFTCEYNGSREFVLTSGTGSPRASGLTVADGAMAAFLRIESSNASVSTTLGREVNQEVSQVIPVATAGPGGEGAQLTGGVSVSPSGADYSAFFNNVLRKRRDVTMMLLPGQPWTTSGPTAAISAALAHAEEMQSRMVIIDPPAGHEFADASDVEAIAPPTSTYSVMYYPWVSIANPLYNVDTNPTAAKTVLSPPSAFAAGVWTKTDGRRGVWKAPAGVETRLIGATSLEFEVEDTEQAQLNPLGVNCYRKVPSFGPVIWGTRTLSTKAAPEWRYVPVRRTAIFIEQSIYNGIQWAVFELNKHTLWASLRANIGGFMNGLFRAGAFQGETADQAYFVRCNLGDTMTQADIDRGQVIVVVAFAPVKPAEFVIVRIQQKVGQE